MNIKRVSGWVLGVASLAVLAACGGSGSSGGDAQVRVINATRTHASIDLQSTSTSGSTTTATKLVSAVGKAGVSGFVNLGAGNYTVQVTDAGSQSALATAGPSVAKDSSYVLLAYESNGSVKAAWLGENDTLPAAGATYVRVYNAATDAGAVDVYVTSPTADLASVSSPSFSLASSSTPQSTAVTAFTPGTYRVRVTASGNRSDLRLDMPSVVLGDQQLDTLLLMPAAGGALVDGAVLVQKGTYAQTSNGNARVRLVSGLASGNFTASVGGLAVEADTLSPSIGSYVTVPAGSAPWNVAINGNAASVPQITLAAGSDNTLLLTGTAAAVTVNRIDDDNHAPATSGSVNIRLVNALSGTASSLSMAVDFGLVANNVVAGTASAYKSVTGNSSMRLEVTSPLSVTPISLQSSLNIPSGGVYSIFVVGDAATPATTVRRDR